MFILCRRILKLWLLALCLPALTLAQSAREPIKLALIEGLSGPFAEAGEAAFRNLSWAVERVNARGGVHLAEAGAATGVARPLLLERHDSQGQTTQALRVLKVAIEEGARFVLLGHSSATALALIDAVKQHNEREPARRVLLLNYAAIDPALSNEQCSFWHFRFDAHAGMRLNALMVALKEDRALKRVYFLDRDDDPGRALAREARRQLGALRPAAQLVGQALLSHETEPDFLSHAARIKASGAQAVIVGQWGGDPRLLVKAARERGFGGKFYFLDGKAQGVPAAIGAAGLGKVFVVDDWLPNVQTIRSEAFYLSFRERFPLATEDTPSMRMQLMIEALAQALEQAGGTDAVAVARQLEQVEVAIGSQGGFMRASDHQFQQPLVLGVMDKQGEPGVKFDVEASGYGFRVIRSMMAANVEQPSRCRMQRLP